MGWEYIFRVAIAYPKKMRGEYILKDEVELLGLFLRLGTSHNVGLCRSIRYLGSLTDSGWLCVATGACSIVGFRGHPKDEKPVEYEMFMERFANEFNA